jgi:ribulose-5-phosphate 4-epimerase/fuculose-1-phosphate aldolase
VAAEPVAIVPCLKALGAWRSVLRRLGLLGCEPGRYGGAGFGNVSHRAGGGFYISGSQTGHLERLGPNEWVEVLECDPERNFLRARGVARPSAESMTHAAVYAADPACRCVLHVHSPEIFAAAKKLRLPATGAEVPYGTPAMAGEVARLFRSAAVARAGVFAMAGHEDGVVAFGPSVAEAGRKLTCVLVRALS